MKRAFWSAASLCVILLASTSTAAAQPMTPPPARLGTDLAQVRALDARNLVLDEITKRGDDRLGDLPKANEAMTSVELSWVGEIPDWLSKKTRSVTEQTGVKFSFTPAQKTVAQMKEVTNQLAKTFASVSSVSIEMATDRLLVRSASSAAGNGISAGPTALEQMKNLAAYASRQSGVEITLEQSPAPAEFAARTGDTTNFRGGSKYFTYAPSGTLACSTGFPAQLGSQLFIITAAHCSDFLDDRAVTTSQSNGTPGTDIGVTDYVYELNDQNPYDLGLIRLYNSKFNLPSLYADPMSSTLSVRGYDAGGILLNATYCSSGVVTKAKCNLRSVAQEYVCVTSTECFYGIRVTSTDGQPVLCKGDSGGPVYFYQDGFGSNRVTAAGINSYIYPNSGNPNCGNVGGISVVSTAVNIVQGLQVRYE